MCNGPSLSRSAGVELGREPVPNATIIGAPSSNKNAHDARVPEMHQTRQGHQRYFSMRLRIRAASRTGLAHGAVVNAANGHDKYSLADMLHRKAQCV